MLGDIKIQDKLAPVIECGRDTIPCFAASKFVPTVLMVVDWIWFF